jgi:DNA gyrase subunit A
LWVASSNGFIKRSLLGDYPRKGRATGGVATMQLLPKTFPVAAAVLSTAEDAILVTQSGRTARITANELPVVARDRKGSSGIKLDAPDELSRLVVVPA